MARQAVRSLAIVVAALLAEQTAAPPVTKPAIHEAALSHIVAATSHATRVGSQVTLAEMLREVDELRGELSAQHHPHKEHYDAELGEMDTELEDLEDMLRSLEAQEKDHYKNTVVVSHAELQAEIARLRESVRRLKDVELGKDKKSDEKKSDHEGAGDNEATDSRGSDHGASRDTKIADIGAGTGQSNAASREAKIEDIGAGTGKSNAGAHGSKEEGRSDGDDEKSDEKSDEKKDEKTDEKNDEKSDGKTDEKSEMPGRGLDIDTMMPYGDLEPFGREDTARELTEDSLRQSDAMVDQLERAEVAEEKRAVFRALTRLRGAAITSFDGIARSQTGNMDEYARENQWRTAHPVHHLAKDEADVSKWAFPESDD